MTYSIIVASELCKAIGCLQENYLHLAKTARRWIVKVKKSLSRWKWEQRIKEQTGKDPMQCPHCGDYYEYKGEVCLKEGQLAIKYASDQTAKVCLERMICNFTGIKTEKTQQK